MTGPVIILSPGFAANESDSTCLPAQQSLIRELNRLYPSLELIIISFQYPYTLTTYYWNGNKVVPMNGGNKGGLKRVLTWLRVWKTLRRIQKHKKIRGIFSFWMGETSFTCHLFARFFNCKHFTWLLGQDALPGNRYAKYISLQPHSLVAMSDFLADEFAQNYNTRPAHIITHGIEPALFPKLIAARDIDIIGAGSLIPLKQYDVFISVIAELKKSLPHLTVWLCGDGPEMQKLKLLIAAYHLEQTIILAGEIPQKKLLAMMQRSKILLHTSAYEGFGGVCLEALHAGAHVISFIKPMHTWIRHWHVVNDKNEMEKIALALLQEPRRSHFPVTPYLMEDSAKAVAVLFNYNDAATR